MLWNVDQSSSYVQGTGLQLASLDACLGFQLLMRLSAVMAAVHMTRMAWISSRARVHQLHRFQGSMCLV